MSNYEKLKKECPKVLDDIDEFLSANWNLDGTSIEEIVNGLNPTDIIDMYLQWNGIRGWTLPIMDIVNLFYKEKESSNISSVMSGSDKKTYIANLGAECDTEGLIDLTDEEYAVALKVINPDNWRDCYKSNYSGSFELKLATKESLLEHKESLRIFNENEKNGIKPTKDSRKIYDSDLKSIMKDEVKVDVSKIGE